MRLSLLLLTSLVTLACSARNGNRLRFHYGGTTVNFQLNVEVFTPRGLKVSIPHKDGLEMFAFHGKVNSPFSDSRGDSGTLAHDVTGSIDGQWVYENKDIQLQIGDVLNFWIFLQYKGAGQRFNDLSHAVKKLTPTSLAQTTTSYVPHNTMAIHNYEHSTRAPVYNLSRPTTTTTYKPVSLIHHRPEPTRTDTQKVCECNENTLKEVRTQMNYTVTKIKTLEENISPLEEKLNSLTETVVELIKNMDIGTKLLLTGDLPVRTNPVEDVRHLIVEKLKLYDLKTTILQAEYKNNGISFEVTTSIDKLRILKRSNDVLSKLSYQIIDPEKPVFDVRMAK